MRIPNLTISGTFNFGHQENRSAAKGLLFPLVYSGAGIN
jgi:hypothetical protein